MDKEFKCPKCGSVKHVKSGSNNKNSDIYAKNAGVLVK